MRGLFFGFFHGRCGGQNGAGLAIDLHHGEQNGVRAHRFQHPVAGHRAVLFRRHQGHLEPLLLQCFQGIQGGLVLDLGADDVPAKCFSLPGGALDGGVDALGAAGGEDHLLRLAPHRPGHLPSCLLHGIPGLFAHGMESGGVAVILPHQAEGGLSRLLQHLSGGTVIQIVDVFHYLLPLPKLSFRVTARLKTRWPSPLSRLSAQK